MQTCSSNFPSAPGRSRDRAIHVIAEGKSQSFNSASISRAESRPWQRNINYTSTGRVTGHQHDAVSMLPPASFSLFFLCFSFLPVGVYFTNLRRRKRLNALTMPRAEWRTAASAASCIRASGFLHHLSWALVTASHRNCLIFGRIRRPTLKRILYSMRRFSPDQ